MYIKILHWDLGSLDRREWSFKLSDCAVLNNTFKNTYLESNFGFLYDLDLWNLSTKCSKICIFLYIDYKILLSLKRHIVTYFSEYTLYKNDPAQSIICFRQVLVERRIWF